ncbi:hypothetical protein A2U01_0066368, partial [Trifolium medium]|nr:hypothetical protein [Trifolium medium]
MFCFLRRAQPVLRRVQCYVVLGVVSSGSCAARRGDRCCAQLRGWNVVFVLVHTPRAGSSCAARRPF